MQLSLPQLFALLHLWNVRAKSIPDMRRAYNQEVDGSLGMGGGEFHTESVSIYTQPWVLYLLKCKTLQAFNLSQPFIIDCYVMFKKTDASLRS